MKPKGIEKVLVTGGAGFIGSHLVDALVESNYETTIIDCLEEQVHGSGREKPEYLTHSARFLVGDILDRPLLDSILPEVDAVVHLAAMVGVGQSMYQIHRYLNSNTSGTAMLLDAVVNSSNSIRKVVAASSMSIYGEGKYRCDHCQATVFPSPRPLAQLESRIWDHACPTCGHPLSHQPTDEETPPAPTSIYAMSKRHQEETALLIGKTYGIPTVGLRFFNVYGPRQALSNPYTGACAIFSSRILNGKPPYIFEDGGQLRDFIHVRDVARAILLALERNNGDYMPINIASGRPVSILELAETLTQLYGANLKPNVSGEFRKGDIRHCYADVTQAKELLGFEARIGLKEGLADLVQWARLHGWGAADLFEKALRELKEKRLA
jgi:dTDP-L-rhamnose 4-epimerase